MSDSGFGRVHQPALAHSQEGSELVRSGGLATRNLKDLPLPLGQRIGNQRTVAAPGVALGAHDSSRLLAGGGLEQLKAVVEFPGLHVVRKAAEGEVTPAHVRRIA